MSVEEIEAYLSTKKPAAAPIVDKTTVELANKIKAMETEMAMQKATPKAVHTAPVPVVLSEKEAKLKVFQDRLLAIPSVKAAFDAHNQKNN